MMALPGTACRRRIYLMRHAEVFYFDDTGRPLDPRHVPLTAKGREQAQAAAALLADIPFDAALCSGLPRTAETARLVLGNRPLDVRVDVRLNEAKAGRLRDVPEHERGQVIACAYDGSEQPGARFIGGEPWRELERRVLAVWADLAADDSWLNVLIVAHDAVNRVLLAHVAGSGLCGMKAFEQDPGCINIVEVDVRDARMERTFLRAVNLAPYDPIRAGSHLTVMEKIHRAFFPRPSTLTRPSIGGEATTPQ
jgi:probable phosphoglycerate mutase